MKKRDDWVRQLGLRTGLLLALLCCSTACFKDPPEWPEILEWNPEIAFPIGENSYGLNAVSGFDTTLLDLDTITGFPDWVDEAELVMEGTVSFSMASVLDNLDRVNSMLFRVNLYNGFPDKVLAQAYFLDNTAATVDSMFSEGPMLAGPGTVIGDGETVQPSHSWQDADFDRARIEGLEDAVEILFRATLLVSAPDTLWIPYYPSYKLNVRIGAMLDFTMEL